MSYILDALRRADDERRRHPLRTPAFVPGDDLAPRAGPPRRKLPYLLLAVAALLGAVTWWLIATPAPDRETRPATALPTPPAAVILDAPSAVANLPPTGDRASSDRLPDAPREAAGRAIAAVGLDGGPAAPAEETSGAQPPHDPAHAEGEPTDPAVPWHALSPEQREGLTRPRLDVHVYADVPEKRFVMIGMRRFREGDRLGDGALLERIDAEGIVLVHGDLRYAVPRR
ncbi:MAG: general secretion pathway protein GspB [Gammaproteobacteria bacterium]|nr:general secretion pathway protein GspB [Gammaproteobacteria bacterium]